MRKIENKNYLSNNILINNIFKDFDDILNNDIYINFEEKYDLDQKLKLYNCIFNYCWLKFRMIKLWKLIKIISEINNKSYLIIFFKNRIKVKKDFLVNFLLKLINYKIIYLKKLSEFNSLKINYQYKIFINKNLNKNRKKIIYKLNKKYPKFLWNIQYLKFLIK